MPRGLNRRRLDDLHNKLAARGEAGEVPGLVALVACGRDVHVEPIARKAFGHDEPIQRDAIFRIASLTKPIVGAAAMSLVENGALTLGDPVARWTPELANPRVLRT